MALKYTCIGKITGIFVTVNFLLVASIPFLMFMTDKEHENLIKYWYTAACIIEARQLVIEKLPSPVTNMKEKPCSSNGSLRINIFTWSCKHPMITLAICDLRLYDGTSLEHVEKPSLQFKNGVFHNRWSHSDDRLS